MDSQQQITAYLTKYALAGGILEVHGVVQGNYLNAKGYVVLFGKQDYCLTREDAIRRVGEMRDKRIASLKKQIAKLEKLNVNRVKAVADV